MLAHRVVEHLDVIEHVLPGFLACFLGTAPDTVALERREEALGDGIVMAVATSAHRVLKIVSPDERSPVHAGKLRALIRVDQYPLLRLAPPFRHVQRLQHHIGGLPARHRPAHHTAGIEIDHDSQVGKALQGANVGDVCHPGPVWRSHIELAIQSVVDRQGRFAAIAPRSALVADLRLDAR